MRILLVIMILSFPFTSGAQTRDSLSLTKEIDSLIFVSQNLITQQEYEHAILIVGEAMQKVEVTFGKTHVQYATCAHNMGRIYLIQEKYHEAEPFCIQAKDIRAKILGKTSLEYAVSIKNLAAVYRLTGQYEKAIPYYLETLEILTDKHSEYGNVLNDLAIVYHEMGNYESAEPLYLESKNIREQLYGKSDPVYAASLNNLANFYLQIGDYDKVEDLYLESKNIQEISSGKTHPDYVALLNNLAGFYGYIGQDEMAEMYYVEAKNIRENFLDKQHIDYANSLNGLAMLSVNKGQFNNAELLFEESRSIYLNTIGEHHPEYGNILNNLSELYYRIGQFTKAEYYILEAKKNYANSLGTDHPFYAGALNALAMLNKIMKNYSKSEQYYLDAMNILTNSVGKEHPEYGSILINLGNLYNQIGQYEKAEPLFKEAKNIFEVKVGVDDVNYASALNGLAFIYQMKGDFKLAESIYLDVKKIYEKTLGIHHPDYANFLTILSICYRQQGNYKMCKQFLEEAIQIQYRLLHNGTQYLSEIELLQFSQMFLRSQDQYFSFTKEKENGNTEMSAFCYDNILFYKGFVLTSIKQLKRLALADLSTTKKYIEFTELHRQLANEYAKPYTEQKNDFVLVLQDKINTLEKLLARTVSGFGESMQQVSWLQVQQQLQPGEIAIEFVHYQYYNPNVTDSIYYSAIVLRPEDTLPHFVTLFEEKELTKLRQGLTSATDEKINLLYDFIPEGDGEKLYKMIWQPLEGLLKNVNKVYCSLSGELFKINLGAIPINSKNVFADQYQLSMLGSTRQIAIPNQLNKSNENLTAYLAGGIHYKRDSTVLVHQKEDFVASLNAFSPDALIFKSDTSTRNNPLKYLAHSLKEVRDINQILLKSNFLTQLDTGHYATEATFKQLGKNNLSPKIIHIATHGFFSEDHQNAVESNFFDANNSVENNSPHPMIRSGLILAGSEETWSTGIKIEGQEDGILTAYEISQMNLGSTDLVVLSACETGLGEIKINEGVYGLQRAFKIAGAKYLIMSLWNVNDDASRQFMTDFYEQWILQKKSIPEAFTATQRNMKAKHSGTNPPFYWAGFVLVE